MLYIANDLTVSVQNLTADAVIQTDATVSAQLHDETGATVGSAVSLTGDGEGNYLGLLASATTSGLVEGAIYTITITPPGKTLVYVAEKRVCDGA